jgi:hypothetical protein
MPKTTSKHLEQGEIKTGTINDYGSPQRIKNAQRSTKLAKNTHKPYPDRPTKN